MSNSIFSRRMSSSRRASCSSTVSFASYTTPLTLSRSRRSCACRESLLLRIRKESPAGRRNAGSPALEFSLEVGALHCQQCFSLPALLPWQRRSYPCEASQDQIGIALVMASKSGTENSALRALPSVDAVLRTDAARELTEKLGTQHIATLARRVTDKLRGELQTNPDGREYSRETLLKEAEQQLRAIYESEQKRGVQWVINATGVILHTNLGRAPLADDARRAISEEAARDCTLEFDLATGERGSRGSLVEELLVELTGAESALVVNNCAAAALLILNVLARDGETIVS